MQEKKAEPTGSVTDCRADDSDQAESRKRSYLLQLVPHLNEPRLWPYWSLRHAVPCDSVTPLWSKTLWGSCEGVFLHPPTRLVKDLNGPKNKLFFYTLQMQISMDPSPSNWCVLVYPTRIYQWIYHLVNSKSQLLPTHIYIYSIIYIIIYIYI